MVLISANINRVSALSSSAGAVRVRHPYGTSERDGSCTTASSRTHTVSELKSLCITCQLFFPEFYSSEVGVDDCSKACHIIALRSVSAASARAAATSATASLQMLEKMLLLPGNCCPTFCQNTCVSAKVLFLLIFVW